MSISILGENMSDFRPERISKPIIFKNERSSIKHNTKPGPVKQFTTKEIKEYELSLG